MKQPDTENATGLQLRTGLVVPAPPLPLSASERRTYQDIGERLAQAGLLDVIDGYVLARLAQDIQRAAVLKLQIEDDGDMLESAQGAPMANPLIAALDRVQTRILSTMNALGMTPAGRKKIRGSQVDKSAVNAANARSKWGKRRRDTAAAQ